MTQPNTEAVDALTAIGAPSDVSDPFYSLVNGVCAEGPAAK